MRAWKHEIWAYFYMAGISGPETIQRAKFMLLVKKKRKMWTAGIWVSHPNSVWIAHFISSMPITWAFTVFTICIDIRFYTFNITFSQVSLGLRIFSYTSLIYISTCHFITIHPIPHITFYITNITFYSLILHYGRFPACFASR